MGSFTVRHTFNCDVDTFWEKIFLDPEFNKELYLKELNFDGYDVLEERDEGDKLHRRIRTAPRSEAPKAVKKVLGDSLSYVEEGFLDRAEKKYRYKVIPSTLADKSDIGGELWAEPRGEGKCERICRVNIKIKVFGVGKLVESFVEKTTADSYDQAAVFTNKFIERQGL
ncbi:MAG: DUF2505 domain-containing protein [Myxococcota bacterium]